MLFDVKSIYLGNPNYCSNRAENEQCGAVKHREQSVWTDYMRLARDHDRRYSPANTSPVLDLLLAHTQTRGLVFDNFAEATQDVHDLIAAAAEQTAQDKSSSTTSISARADAHSFGPS